ncbi:MAG TPA: hypothetical protein VGR21_08825, partial [Cryptosporangiaceae bacterium]|nr:hypothetical protein [Cryptosporangiaceae bacterium]
MMGQEARILTVRRVLADGPFAEVGEPHVVSVSSPHGCTIVGGLPGYPQWSGHDVSSTSGAQAWYRLGIYRTDDLRCLHLLSQRWPTHSVDVHPDLPLVAVGAGSYDGGWTYTGELLVIDLETGDSSSVLDESREVTRVRWEPGGSLRLVLSPRDDGEIDETGVDALQVVVPPRDWRTVAPGSIALASLDSVPTDRPLTADPAVATRTLAGLAAAAGQVYVPRHNVWAVTGLTDGRILAALDGVALECWSDAGERFWAVPTEASGCQILLAPDEHSALSNAPRLDGPLGYRSVRRVNLADGTIVPAPAVGHAVVLTRGPDGWYAMRPAGNPQRGQSTLVMSPSDDVVAQIEMGGYDLFNHFFDIARSPTLLFLQGKPGRWHEDKWVVGLDPTSM